MRDVGFEKKGIRSETVKVEAECRKHWLSTYLLRVCTNVQTWHSDGFRKAVYRDRAILESGVGAEKIFYGGVAEPGLRRRFAKPL